MPPLSTLCFAIAQFDSAVLGLGFTYDDAYLQNAAQINDDMFSAFSTVAGVLVVESKPKRFGTTAKMGSSEGPVSGQAGISILGMTISFDCEIRYQRRDIGTHYTIVYSGQDSQKNSKPNIDRRRPRNVSERNT